MTTNERNEFIRSLRELATFLESNPAVPTPRAETAFNVFIDREELREVAGALGKADKNATESYFYLTKRFGQVRIDFNVHREEVCTRRVVGTKVVPERIVPAHEEEIVEWNCQPILAESE